MGISTDALQPRETEFGQQPLGACSTPEEPERNSVHPTPLLQPARLVLSRAPAHTALDSGAVTGSNTRVLVFALFQGLPRGQQHKTHICNDSTGHGRHREIPVVSSKPPITSPCYSGLDQEAGLLFLHLFPLSPQIQGCKSRLKFRGWPHPLVLGPLADG